MNRIPMMLDGCDLFSAEYDYSTPEIKITGVYIGEKKVIQEDIIDIILAARGIDELEQEIRDNDFTAMENEEFERENRWPDRPARMHK